MNSTLVCRNIFLLGFITLISVLNSNASPTIDRGLDNLLSNGRIVGGFDAVIEQFPWTVSMIHMGSHRCGGAIIKSNYILTAAHCTRGTLLSLTSIRAGSTVRSSGGIVRQVARIHEHPNYNPLIVDSDISVMLLTTPLAFGQAISPIQLPAQNEKVRAGDTAFISGWGSLQEGGTTANLLRYVTVPIIESSFCRQLYTGFNPITDNMLCAGVMGTGGKDACQGDSGGPMVVNNVLTGIVSWGYGCARSQYPGVYTQVSTFRTWIDGIVV